MTDREEKLKSILQQLEESSAISLSKIRSLQTEMSELQSSDMSIEEKNLSFVIGMRCALLVFSYVDR